MSSKNVGKKSALRLTRAEARKAAKIVTLKKEPIKKAMSALGYADSVATGHPERLAQHPLFQEEVSNLQSQIAAACKTHDLTVDRLVKKAVDGLEAKKPMSGAGGMVLKLKGGDVSGFGHGNAMIPDHEAQVKWWDRCAIFLGIKKDDDGGARQPINVGVLVQIVNQTRQERGLAS